MKKSIKLFLGVIAISFAIACGNRADSDGNDIPDTRYDDNTEMDTLNTDPMTDTTGLIDSGTTPIGTPTPPIVP